MSEKEKNITAPQTTDGEANEQLDEEIIPLVDEEGNEVNFYHVATLDYKGEWYIFLAPADEVEGIEEDELVIFKLEQDEDGSDVFTPVTDEKLEQEVFAEYLKLAEESGEHECGCGHEHGHEHVNGMNCGCGESCGCEEGCGCEKK